MKINLSTFDKQYKRMKQDMKDFHNPLYTKTAYRKQILGYLYALDDKGWSELHASISKYHSLDVIEHTYDEITRLKWIKDSLSLFSQLKEMGYDILQYHIIEPVMNYLIYHQQQIDRIDKPTVRGNFKDMFVLLMNDLDVIDEFLGLYEYTILDLRQGISPIPKLKGLDKTLARIDKQLSYFPELKERYSSCFKIVYDMENILVTCKNQLLSKTLSPIMFSNLNYIDLKPLLSAPAEINNVHQIEDSGLFQLFCAHYRVTNSCSYLQFKQFKENLFLSIQRDLSLNSDTRQYDSWYYQMSQKLPNRAKVKSGYNTVTK